MDAALQERINKAAVYCLTQRGFSVIPISTETKKPTLKWGVYIEGCMAPHEWQNHGGCNLGIVTGEISGVVVVDCDSLRSYQGWLETKKPTPMRVKTKRGMHFYYRHPGQYVKSDSHIKDSSGFDYDVKGDRSYVMFPPSLRSGHQYQIVPCEGNTAATVIAADQLPEFEMEWRPERAPSAEYNDSGITNGLAYIMKIEAVEGQGGDKNTFRAAAVLKDSGLSESEALAALCEWNQTNARPPWSVRDLLRKIRCAYGSDAGQPHMESMA